MHEGATMKHETTPAKITEKILELCNMVVPEATPEYIPVEAQTWGSPMECFPNVQRIVREQRGTQINGWAIWQWANILIEAEAHSVWESPEGKLIDITPHDYGEKEILFLRDYSMVYSGQNIRNIRCALTNSPLVAEYIGLSEQIEAIMCSYKPGTEIPLVELQFRLLPLRERIVAITTALNQKASPNSFCPCQSGLKYKKCCGR